jgi:hypothetical protein
VRLSLLWITLLRIALLVALLISLLVTLLIALLVLTMMGTPILTLRVLIAWLVILILLEIIEALLLLEGLTNCMEWVATWWSAMMMRLMAVWLYLHGLWTLCEAHRNSIYLAVVFVEFHELDRVRPVFIYSLET